MWWIILIVAIVFIIFSVRKDYNSNVDSNITKFGGMQVKYCVLIEYLKHSGLKTQKVTKDSVILSSGSVTLNLDYVGHNLEVRMTGMSQSFGNISEKWIFRDGYPQEKMIEDINESINLIIKKVSFEDSPF